MRERFAYLPRDGEPYLLECWLRGLPAGTRVRVLSDHTSARTISNTHKAVVTWHDPYGDNTAFDLGSLLTEDGLASLVVPRAVERVPMRYRSGVLMADLAPHYPLLHQAWQWGFRELHFVAHGSEERVALPHLLDAYQNRHQGQRCFVVGNGPSLAQLDMSRLKDEITLGSNRCFLGYEQWGFPFTYWGVYDQYQIETYHPIYEAHVPAETTKFYPVEYGAVINVENGCPVNMQWPQSTARAFSAEPGHLYVGFTVTYMLLQIAAVMGCDPIILIGTDHRYALSRRGYSPVFRRLRRQATRHLRGGRLYESARAAYRTWKIHGTGPGRAPALWGTADATSPTHFTDAYTDGGKNRFLPPEPEEAERDFDEAHRWAQSMGRTIVNATPGSALNSFPMMDFDDLF